MPNTTKNTVILTSIIAPVVVAMLTALFTDVGEGLKNKLFPPKVYIEGSILQEGKPIPNITVYLDDNMNSNITDMRGKFYFAEVPTGTHSCSFSYLGETYRYSLLVREGIDQTISEQFDIGAKEINTPDKKPEEKLIAKVPVTIRPTYTGQNNNSSLPAATNSSAQTLTPPDILFQETQQTARDHVSASDLISQLELHAWTNKQDRNSSGKQFAVNYYVYGKEAHLDQIKAVYYIRNHKSFSEFANDRYLTSYDRSSNFNYKGYQWGFINSVYVNVILKNGTESGWKLMDVVYD